MAIKRTTIAAAASMVLAALGWALRTRRNPSACPYSQRLFLDFPRPFMGRGTLLDLLAPAAGERLLEIGPGTGYYTVDVAGAIRPVGRLDIIDLQQQMLDATIQRSSEKGLSNIVSSQGNAQALPYPDATFDGAYLIATLGEVPEKDLALRELHRVLKRGGRLVVGEGQPDPHMVRFDSLREKAIAAGFHFDRRLGGRLGYMARFELA